MKNLLYLLLIITFWGCDKVDQPIQDPTNQNTDTTVLKRKIVIEEFTGHLCISCPPAAEEIKRLQQAYPGQIIPIAFHTGNFAIAPTSLDVNGDGIYDYTKDFNTTEGDDYRSTFGVNSYPSGMISRTKNGTLSSFSKWEADFSSIKDDKPEASLEIKNTFNSGNRNLSIDIETTWLSDTPTEQLYLQVYIIEDHISGWQKDSRQTPADVENYDHRHIFRTAVNSTWGESILHNGNNTSVNTSYSYSIPASWNAANCEVVAFIYKQAPSYEIIQAENKKIQ